MTAEDKFGLDRESRIVGSGVRRVFTPHTPIDSVDLFAGREKQVRKLIEQMNTPGQHALLYGDRGVGKSSLANIVSAVLKEMVGGRLYTKRCDSEDTFESIVAKPLRGADVDIDGITTTHRKRKGGKGGISAAGLSLQGGMDSETVEEVDASVDLQPSQVVDDLQDHSALLVIDEADAIQNRTDRRKLAEFIKLLSDAKADLNVLIVGIAETGGQLTGEHPSVQRCLKETELGGMSESELSEIIFQGADKLDLTFDENVVMRIVRVSGGYPHFTQLLALKCAEEAIADGRTRINVEDLDVAIDSAVDDAEGTLSRRYREATRSYETDMYRIVLVAAAQIGQTEFTAKELREAIAEETGEPIRQNRLNNYLSQLVSEGRETVLRRVQKGIYKFNDPRMPPYVKIANSKV